MWPNIYVADRYSVGGIKPKEILQFKKSKGVFPTNDGALNRPTAPAINKSDLARFSNISNELGNLPNAHHLSEIL